MSSDFPAKPNTPGFATRAIHHGYDARGAEGALTPPLHLTSTFTFESAEQGGRLFSGEEQGHFYSRISNPTTDLLEKRIATLENGEAGLATASGMGAITSALWTFLRPGDELITDLTLYGCTFAFMRQGLARFGITITHVDLRAPSPPKPGLCFSKRPPIRTCGWSILRPFPRSPGKPGQNALSTIPTRRR